MKPLLFALMLGLLLTQTPALSVPPVFCQHAVVLQALALKGQERKTPPGEWCQRPQAEMPKGAHACSCHKANCKDPDPNKLPAHTDPQCLNYCTTSQCACPVQDCI